MRRVDLRSSAFVVGCVVFAVAATAGVVILWRRLPGPRPLQVLQRVLAIGLCQFAAVLAVFALVNSANGFYDSWSDLVGSTVGQSGATDPTGAASPTVAGPRAARAVEFSAASLGPAPGGAEARGVVATFVGARSHLPGEAYVWTPPGYASPADAHLSYPVLEVFAGYPGTPISPLEEIDLVDHVQRLITAHVLPPLIVVSPTDNPGGADLECLDYPHEPRVATWLTEDVPHMLAQHYRVLPAAGSWAALGYSEGGYCAAHAALADPGRYAAAVSLSGYDRPSPPRALRDAGSTDLRNDLTRLALAPADRPVSLLLAASGQDGGTVHDARVLQSALAGHPGRGAATLMTLARGGHNAGTWQRMLTPALRWLGGRLPRPSARPAAVDAVSRATGTTVTGAMGTGEGQG